MRRKRSREREVLALRVQLVAVGAARVHAGAGSRSFARIAVGLASAAPYYLQRNSYGPTGTGQPSESQTRSAMRRRTAPLGFA